MNLTRALLRASESNLLELAIDALGGTTRGSAASLSSPTAVGRSRSHLKLHILLKVYTTVTTKIFSDVTLSSMVDIYQRFEETCCVHLQELFGGNCCLHLHGTLKTESPGSSEILAVNCRATRLRIPEYGNFQFKLM
jgi:hypothetical protein